MFVTPDDRMVSTAANSEQGTRGRHHETSTGLGEHVLVQLDGSQGMDGLSAVPSNGQDREMLSRT